MKADARRRFARRRLARRLVRLRPLLVGLAVAATVGAVAWLFLVSSLLAAEKVEVSGTEVVTEDKVREVAAVPLGTPLARVDVDAVRARLEDLLAVRSVDVTRCWPDAVCIAVTEREAVAVVDKEGNLFGLDESGVMFRRFERRPADLPLVMMQPTTPVDALAEAADIVTVLPAELVRKVEHLDVRTVDEISLRLRSGAHVRWGSADDSANKARVLVPLLAARPGAAEYNVSVAGSPTVRMP